MMEIFNSRDANFSEDLKEICEKFNGLLQKCQNISNIKNKDKVIFCTRGEKFSVSLSKLGVYSKSRLADIKEIFLTNPKKEILEDYCDRFDPETNEFYFNRSPTVLNLILNSYNQDLECVQRLHFNIETSDICVFEFEDDFKYWNVDYEELIEPCCMMRIQKQKSNLQEHLDKEKSLLEAMKQKDLFENCCFRKIRETIWNLIEEPSSSIFAKV